MTGYIRQATEVYITQKTCFESCILECVKTRGSVCLHFSANEKADTILY